MLGQKGSWLGAYSDDVFSHAVTVAMDNKNVFAEVALTKSYTLGEDYEFEGIGISQIVANGKVEDFAEPFPRIAWRTNCATMTFRIDVYQAYAQGRWIANFW